MNPTVLALVVAVIAFLAIILLAPRRAISGNTESRKQAILQRISKEGDANLKLSESSSVIRKDITADITSPLLRSLVGLALVRSMYELILKAGFGNRIGGVSIFAGVAYLVVTVLLLRTKFAVIAPFLALGIVWFLLRKFMKGRIRKRNEQFINQFPDAIDMIVRSVRSGHPLNNALRLIAENTDPPVSTEFRQVVDEIAYGRTLVEALGRLATRIDEPDLQFFIVVLSVQQETGGNLAEVLTNLSNVIRKRKQLRMKIKAMTSEGRATSYILGALPVLVTLAVALIQPGYLNPLFTTFVGNIVFAGSVTSVITGFLIVRSMVNIEI